MLPKLKYSRIHDVAHRWGMTAIELLDYATQGMIRVHAFVIPFRETEVSGVVESGHEPGREEPEVIVLTRAEALLVQERQHIKVGDKRVDLNRVVVSREEEERFEAEHGPLQPPDELMWGQALAALLDRSHEHHAVELAAAVECWIAMYLGGGHRESRGHRRQIEAWLRAHHPGESNEAYKRMTTVVNPNKRGGAPPM